MRVMAIFKNSGFTALIAIGRNTVSITCQSWALQCVIDKSFIDTSFFTFAKNPVGTLIPLRKVHIALFSSGVRLKHAAGRVYFPLASGTRWSYGITFSCTMSFCAFRPSFDFPMSIKVAMRLSKTFFYTCIASMAWGILKEDRLFLKGTPSTGGVLLSLFVPSGFFFP